MAVEVKKKHAMAFFDGQNLFQHAMHAFGHYHPNYDPIKLHHAVCQQQGWVPNLTRFYTGVPNHAQNEMWAAYWSKRIMFMKTAGIHVTTRPLRYHREDSFDAAGTPTSIMTPHEKGIDVRLALDIVATARRQEWDVAIIFSQDQDLAEVVSEVRAVAKEQNRSVDICCAYPAGPNASSPRGVNNTQWIPMDETFYNACIDPTDYRPPRKPT
ncbi:NYN domain-containing protein [Rhizobium pusense]|uniref:NYN domain-containing protein n=1 Tax=Agrobacterium pusense TaxID=648995 RepID=UPI00244AE359|nr:NYN domain-containing protein [Agrobacterium pusense]MDH0116788.1 NYN domain-containing protein [Agrobacterium pusense]